MSQWKKRSINKFVFLEKKMDKEKMERILISLKKSITHSNFNMLKFNVRE